MASLVACEDSESEEELEDPSIGSHAPNQDYVVCDESNTTSKTRTFHPNHEQSLLGNHGNASGGGSPSPQLPNLNYGSSWASQHDNVTAYPSSIQEKFLLPQTLPHMPQRWSDVSHQAKRQHSAPPGVKPYIPKRQRLGSAVATVDPRHPAHQGNGAENILEESARVKPYLSQKPHVAQAPRRLLMSLGGHQGPVNTVKWCPVPHLSHLLLSASMDKTLKVWDGVESGRCLRTYTCHSGAVRAVCWSPCGRHLLSGSFDNTAVITDAETGQPKAKLDNQFKVMCAALHPSSPDVLLCGGYSSVVKAWDSRSCKMVKTYKAGIQQTLDILFLRGGADFITSSDCVSRDSADRTLIAWDYQTTARLSNQIYHERFTCPSLALHPLEESFVAQTNGNYMSAFSSQLPYRMNKRRRYEGHKVEGYAVQCDFSHDGTILASGSATGAAHFYDYHNTRTLHTIQAHEQPCVSVTQHPVLPATAATCDWAGEIKVWH